jgi:flagellar motor switch protein FliM
MADQILSQEEIDALLSAMDKGEVDLKQDAQSEPVIQEYSLTSQNASLRAQYFALDEVYDRFGNMLSRFMSNTFQRPIEVELFSTETVKYTDFISSFTTPTNLNIFTMDPLIGSALMAVEPELVFSLIDCMFGGPGKPLETIREFTLIEQRMMKKFAVEVLSRLEEAWSAVHKVHITLSKSENKPEYVHLLNPNESAMIIVFAIKGEEFSGNIHFCLSQLMLEPIKQKLCTTCRREKETHSSWYGQLKELIKDTPVNVIAELGRTFRTVGEVLSLQVDDVLQMPSGPKDQVVLKVGGVPKYLGYPGVIKGNRAVEIAKGLNR